MTKDNILKLDLQAIEQETKATQSVSRGFVTMNNKNYEVNVRDTFTEIEIQNVLKDLLEFIDEAVKVEEIERFYASDTAERLRSAKHVKREVPFTYAKADADGDHQIIQGIVDCLFEEQDGWVLLDYKTDRLAHLNDVKMEMAERYGVQLTVYQEAVEAILRIPVKERLLYLFAASQEVNI